MAFREIYIRQRVTVFVWTYPDEMPERINPRIKKVIKDYFEKGKAIMSIEGFNFWYRNKGNEVWVYQWAEEEGDKTSPTIFRRGK